MRKSVKNEVDEILNRINAKGVIVHPTFYGLEVLEPISNDKSFISNPFFILVGTTFAKKSNDIETELIEDYIKAKKLKDKR